MHNSTPIPDSNLPLPIKFSDFILICGGVNVPELVQTIFSRSATDTLEVKIRDYKITPAFSLADDFEPISDSCPGLLDLIIQERGPEYFIKKLIEAFDATYIAYETRIVVSDAQFVDIPAMIERFGNSSVLVIQTGELRVPPTPCRTLWLPLQSTSEREKLLERELGLDR